MQLSFGPEITPRNEVADDKSKDDVNDRVIGTGKEEEIVGRYFQKIEEQTLCADKLQNG